MPKIIPYDEKMEILRARETAGLLKQKKLPTAHGLVRGLKKRLAIKHSLPQSAVITNPLEFLIMIMAGTWPDDILLRHPQKAGEEFFVPMNVRLEAAKIAIPYTHSKAPTEISGPGGGPIPITKAIVDVAEMMRIPELREKIEDLQLELARRPQPAAYLEPAGIVEATVERETVHGQTLDERSDSDGTGEDDE